MHTSNQLNLCTVLENYEAVHLKHGKYIFVLRGEYLRTRTINLDLIKYSVALAVELSTFKPKNKIIAK